MWPEWAVGSLSNPVDSQKETPQTELLPPDAEYPLGEDAAAEGSPILRDSLLEGFNSASARARRRPSTLKFGSINAFTRSGTETLSAISPA